ncbi:MAG: hypothetical protein QOF18_1512 [Frankiaceae bacterium]|nr:hypothetical protein [Frankiaceae bacterium]
MPHFPAAHRNSRVASCPSPQVHLNPGPDQAQEYATPPRLWNDGSERSPSSLPETWTCHSFVVCTSSNPRSRNSHAQRQPVSVAPHPPPDHCGTGA